SKVNAESVSLLVNARGIWAYQFDDVRRQELARQLAGKKLTDAQKVLNGQSGIANSKIDALSKNDPLPTDPSQITFKIQSVSGEKSSGNEDNNGGNSNNSPTPVSGR
ncbi:MAG: hypothetical protein H0U76_11385, partial [Ktedonobacteraceae bacterium]|nr:hypothetical protein [Ktedonobacteraceae bacterium]